MSDAVISPVREKHDPLLPRSGLLLVNPAETAIARQAGRAAWRRHFLFNSNLYVSPDDTAFWAGPCVGAPMAVLSLEKLIALGARHVVVVGWCGALTADLEVGDVFLPNIAVSEEGTSTHYPLALPMKPSGLLVDRLKDILALSGDKIAEGPVWTTDAPYRETRDKIRRYQDEGVCAVEMECAALFRVAAFRGIELAAVLLVSDLLWKEPWQPSFKGKLLRSRSRLLLASLFGALGEL